MRMRVTSKVPPNSPVCPPHPMIVSTTLGCLQVHLYFWSQRRQQEGYLVWQCNFKNFPMSVKMSPVTSRIVIVLVQLHGPAITSVPERSETALQCQSKTSVSEEKRKEKVASWERKKSKRYYEIVYMFENSKTSTSTGSKRCNGTSMPTSKRRCSKTYSLEAVSEVNTDWDWESS